MKRYLCLLSLLLVIVIAGCGMNDPELSSKKNEPPVEDTSERIDNDDQVEVEKEKEQATDGKNDSSDSEELDNSSRAITNKENSRDGPLSELKVHYIDAGQADATLLQFESYTILIDAGDWNSSNVVNYLNTQQIAQIDIAIGTHPDADHIGQMDKIINQFDVGEVWLSGNLSTSQTFERVMQAIDSSGVGYDEPRTGDVFDIGSMKIEILYPNSISGKSNEESISIKATYGEVDFVFTGDAGTRQEQEMIRLGVPLDADFLQLGHHGSNTSTSRAFLEAVSPEIAIYSAGRDNSYGHPHEEVMDAVTSFGAKLYGTDVHGTIIVTTNGVDYQITTKQDGNITPSDGGHSTKTPQEEINQNQGESEQTPKDQCININEASKLKVQEIIHIGPSRAEDLISLRPFNSIDDLTKISGIGPARIDDIKSEGLACIGG